ncbi:leucyl aminopeptidase [Aliiruegeria lutimaris]|uniref:Probable cytosol aminopeptidase n=1 Tax=Aliiruegeria lutimaris TaxID=571298 RepID=A0A1G8J440_9RHOB|nr:leucyl aminopeptidase [Aliiruegeria lutimaris]SDI25430.1 leucyl aminopeptidase [Aliiruegeria lutimaris]
MTTPPVIDILPLDLDAIAGFEGRVTVFLPEGGKLDQAARRVNRLTKGALARFAESDAFGKLGNGEAVELAWPVGMAASAVQVVRLDAKSSPVDLRKAGAAIGAARGKGDVLVLGGARKALGDLALGASLRSYAFKECRTGEAAEQAAGSFTLMVTDPDGLNAQMEAVEAVAEGVYFTRDLVNLPANYLTTESFAEKLAALGELGVKVEVLDEAELEKQGMTMLLGVGQGSESPSKVVVMRWNGGGEEAPLALIGKGVVFDTGGISLKPGAGMEDMTMDMGGAGVVSGVMKTLALRKARANVVGVVGLVENMPDGKAQRPGDIVASMKGDTVEVINTDAEGRLVLGDVMWYTQERFNPCGMIDLATLTGAIILALGHDNAGVFSNDDAFAGAFLNAAGAEGEGAWRMPIGASYAELLKSEKADLKNVGTRAGGSITAAEFLHRFVKEGTPWIHLDIAGVAQPAKPPAWAPKGASGWGVMALDRMIRDGYEAG